MNHWVVGVASSAFAETNIRRNIRRSFVRSIRSRHKRWPTLAGTPHEHFAGSAVFGPRLRSADARLNDHMHADQMRERLCTHFVHDIAAMDFHGALAEAQVERDDFVRAPLDH